MVGDFGAGFGGAGGSERAAWQTRKRVLGLTAGVSVEAGGWTQKGPTPGRRMRSLVGCETARFPVLVRLPHGACSDEGRKGHHERQDHHRNCRCRRHMRHLVDPEILRGFGGFSCTGWVV